MKLIDLPVNEFSHLITQTGIAIKTGPLVFSIYSQLATVHQCIQQLYAEYELSDANEFIDYHISLIQPRSFRKWLRPQVEFKFDCRTPFKPLPVEQAFPMLEWGMNWCIANHNYQWLILHAAVVARGDRAVILPAPPGSGKSTLCAGLVGKGWRLLSDELAIINHDTLQLIPMPRPISLKNQSIDVIRNYLPEAIMGPVWKDTRKGTISHVKPKAEDSCNYRTVKPAWIIFPKYQAASQASLTPMSKPECLIKIAHNAFNYDVTGLYGFKTLTAIVESSDTYEFTYSSLDDAIRIFEDLAVSG